MTRKQFLIAGILSIGAGTLVAGCVKQDETQQSEIKSMMKSEQKAKDASAEAAKQVKEGNDVLDGK